MSASQGRVSDREYEVLVAAKLGDNKKGGMEFGGRSRVPREWGPGECLPRQVIAPGSRGR